MKYKIFIVLLHYKSYSSLQVSLQRLLKMLVPRNATLQIVTVDNESNKKNLEKIKERFPHIIFLPQKTNLGVSAGFNVGYKYAYMHGADFTMMLSPDLRMENDVIKKLFDTMVKDEKIGIASTKMLLDTDPARIFFVAGVLDKKRKSANHIGFNEIDKGQYDKIVITDFVNCPLLIRREVFEKVGYFRPEFFMYYEDIDWQYRIRKAGLKLICVKNAIAWNMQPDQKGKIYPRKEYYNSRNLLYFIKWNFPLQERIIAYLYTVKEAIALIRNILLSTDRDRSRYKLLGMTDFIKGKLGQRIL